MPNHLVPLKPALFNDFACPECGALHPTALRPLFYGKQLAAEYQCASCGLEFVRDLPVGFTIDHPLAFRKDDHRTYDPSGGAAEKWVDYPEYAAPLPRDFHIERKVLRPVRSIILLNTIDHLYGHVLLKLLNVQYYMDTYPQRGVVVLVPRMFEWLVPKGVAEVWVVDMGLKEGWGINESVDSFVTAQLKQYDEVDLARGYSHPDFTEIDIKRFTGIDPFPLEDFKERRPHVTFIARQDSLWFASIFAKFTHRLLARAGLKDTLGRWFIHRQDIAIEHAMRQIGKRVPQVTFSVVGLGKPRKWPWPVEDLRRTGMDEEAELHWCHTYAKSHVVIGVHGSNMLLPTALAAGCVEILPHDRYGNLVQDICVRYTDRLQIFLYRFVDEFASARSVARHAVSIMNDFEDFFRNMKTNTF
jgi:hypothetical protein